LPVGTPFHERTLALCESLNYREWSGYYTVSMYEMHHEHEYNAIRNSAALIDISPLYKYRLTGRDATRLVNRVICRDINKVAVDQDLLLLVRQRRQVVDDGTITRLGENDYRWTAADPSLRWFQQNALGLDLQLEDISRSGGVGAAGPTSGKLLAAAAGPEYRQPEIFSRDARKNRRSAGGYFAHGVYRRSGLRNLGSVERCGEGMGRTGAEGQTV
jgi:aminomethyltransferase